MNTITTTPTPVETPTRTFVYERTEEQKEKDSICLENVKRGIAWLEENVGPSWVDKIDMGTLDIANATSCVCGQGYPGGYEAAVKKLRYRPIGSFGFCRMVGIEYHELNSVWKQEITKLRSNR